MDSTKQVSTFDGLATAAPSNSATSTWMVSLICASQKPSYVTTYVMLESGVQMTVAPIESDKTVAGSQR